MKKEQKILIAILAILAFGFLLLIFEEKDPDKIMANHCTISVYSSVLGINDCDVDGDEFDLTYSIDSDGYTFLIETVYDDYDIEYWYFYFDDGTIEYTVRIEDTTDGSTCNYLYYDGEEHTGSGSSCSALFGTKSARNYAMELLDDFTELLKFEDITQLSEYLEGYIEANYEE